MKKKLAIIGSGIAGLSSAYFLQNDFDVTLFEKNDYLGRHANTRKVQDSQGNSISIDTGFIVYNELTYPNLIKLFQQLQVPIANSDMSFSFYNPNTQRVIILVKPGLSGIGSIIFRGEEYIMHGKHASINFYDDVIAPYKGELEEWFVHNKSLYLYFLLIFLTVWMVLFPKSSITWKVLKKLPKPPQTLQSYLNYKS